MPNRLLIGISALDTMRCETACALAAAMKCTPCEISLSLEIGPYVHWNRQKLLQTAIKERSTHLMFIDTDVFFQPDSVTRLLAHDKDIVGGLYNIKVMPKQNALRVLSITGEPIAVPATAIPRQLFDRVYDPGCAFIAPPTGFLLINVDRVREVGLDPLTAFDFMRRSNGDLVGEDVAFCERAHMAGLEIWCDPTVAVEHIGAYRY
jgi:GT2 family glycosyltransferase